MHLSESSESLYQMGMDSDVEGALHVTWVSKRINEETYNKNDIYYTWWSLKLMHGVYKNDSWREEVVADLGNDFSSKSHFHSYFKVLANGNMCVAFTDEEGNLAVAKNRGNGWNIVSKTTFSLSNPAKFLIDDIGHVHAVYASIEPSGIYQIHEGIRYATNIKGKWTSELVEKCQYFIYDPLYATTVFDLPNIQLDSEKNVHISYRAIKTEFDGTSIYGMSKEQQQIRYATKNNGNWETYLIAESQYFDNNVYPYDVLRFWNSHSLSIDRYGMPHIFYREIDSGLIEMVKLIKNS